MLPKRGTNTQRTLLWSLNSRWWLDTINRRLLAEPADDQRIENDGDLNRGNVGSEGPAHDGTVGLRFSQSLNLTRRRSSVPGKAAARRAVFRTERFVKNRSSVRSDLFAGPAPLNQRTRRTILLLLWSSDICAGQRPAPQPYAAGFPPKFMMLWISCTRVQKGKLTRRCWKA